MMKTSQFLMALLAVAAAFYVLWVVLNQCQVILPSRILCYATGAVDAPNKTPLPRNHRRVRRNRCQSSQPSQPTRKTRPHSRTLRPSLTLIQGDSGCRYETD